MMESFCNLLWFFVYIFSFSLYFFRTSLDALKQRELWEFLANIANYMRCNTFKSAFWEIVLAWWTRVFWIVASWSCTKTKDRKFRTSAKTFNIWLSLIAQFHSIDLDISCDDNSLRYVWTSYIRPASNGIIFRADFTTFENLHPEPRSHNLNSCVREFYIDIACIEFVWLLLTTLFCSTA